MNPEDYYPEIDGYRGLDIDYPDAPPPPTTARPNPAAEPQEDDQTHGDDA